MKNILLSVALFAAVIAPAHGRSPLDEGVYSVSGSISYNERNSEVGKLTSYSVSPQFMYFVAPGMALGAALLYDKSEYEYAEFETSGFGPIVRYYLVDEGFRPFVEFRYFFEQVSGEATDPGYTAIESQRESTSLAIGAEIFVSRNVALEPALRFSHREIDYPDDFTQASDSTKDETAFSVGVSVFTY